MTLVTGEGPNRSTSTYKALLGAKASQDSVSAPRLLSAKSPPSSHEVEYNKQEHKLKGTAPGEQVLTRETAAKGTGQICH